MDSFQSRLRQAISEANMSQAELARKSGLGRNSISEYLKGKYKASQTSLNAIANALNVDVNWLIGNNVETDKTSQAIDTMVNAILDEFHTYNGHITSEVQLNDIQKILTAYLSAQRTSMRAIVKAYLDNLK